MKINTKIFGEVEIDDDKIIHFPSGIIGFPELSEFALIHDEEKSTSSIHWLQSVQEAAFAMPVMDPLLICADYNPDVEDEILKPLGQLIPEETLVLVTVTVPENIENMTVNLKGPIVINATEKKACQVIVDGEQYPVKYPIYSILEENKRKAGD